MAESRGSYLCVNGSGTEWHPNGFPIEYISEENKAVAAMTPEIPEFGFQANWYPFSKGYGGMWNTAFLNEFTTLLMRSLESMVSFGIKPRTYSKKRDVMQCRERMREALALLRKLYEEHPTLSDDLYKEWLNDGRRAEAWIERFDLSASGDIS